MASEQPVKQDDEFSALQQAAEWFATLSDEPSEQTRNDWQRWLAQSDANQHAWQRIHVVADRFESLRQGKAQRAASNALLANQDTKLSRRSLLGGAFTMAGIAAGAGWLVQRNPWLTDKAFGLMADEATAIGEIRQLVLTDKTQLWLNSASAVNINYGAARRTLALIEGEIHINTAADKQRPFFTETRHGVLQALGTRFSVWQQQDHTVLAVYDGAVKIRLVNGSEQIIKRNQQTRFSADRIAPMQKASAGRQAWTRKLLLAEATPLQEIVTELQRHYPGYLRLAPEISQLKVMGAFPLHDPNKTLSMLETALPIQIEDHFKLLVNIKAK